MADITTRAGKGSPLTNAEVDANFTNLNDGKVEQTSSTGSAKVPTGTEAQRDGTPEAGLFRFNTDTQSFEGYNGDEWGAVGGGNSTGAGLWENSSTITETYAITAGNNALSSGPVTISDGVSVTVPSGSRWTVV
jgi:hypothetical protein